MALPQQAPPPELVVPMPFGLTSNSPSSGLRGFAMLPDSSYNNSQSHDSSSGSTWALDHSISLDNEETHIEPQPVGSAPPGLELPQGPVTLIIKNLPARCTCQDIVDAIEASGFEGRYDFISLPTKRNCLQNKGYAFAAFSDTRVATRFKACLSGARFRAGSDKRISIEVATEHRSLEDIVDHGPNFYQSRFGPLMVSRQRPIKPVELELASYINPIEYTPAGLLRL